MEHIDSIEADFMHYYGIDLIEVFFTISYRKFMAYLVNLPSEAMFRTILNGDKEETKGEDLTPAQIVARLRG